MIDFYVLFGLSLVVYLFQQSIGLLFVGYLSFICLMIDQKYHKKFNRFGTFLLLSLFLFLVLS